MGKLNRQSSYHNTIGAKGAQLNAFDVQAKNLEQFILTYVLEPSKEYTPYDVLKECLRLGYRTKESSVRRALTNLRTASDPKIAYTGNAVVNEEYSNVPNKTIKLKL